MSGDVQGVKDSGPKIAANSAKADDELGNFVNSLTLATTVFGFPFAVVQVVQTLKPHMDPALAALAEVRRLLDAALHFEIADDAEEHQFHVKDVVAPAETSWGTLNEVNFDTHNPLLSVDTLQHDTFGSLQTLTDPIYWHRPYYDQLDWDQEWTGHLVPPDVSQRLGPSLPEVFDYRLVLPSFLEVVLIRTAVVVALRALRPDIISDEVLNNIKAQEFLPRAAVLSENYEKAVAGFVATRTPDPDSQADLQAWESAGRIIAVVDSYAGSGPSDFTPVNWTFDEHGPVWVDDFDRVVFQARYRLGVRSRWISLYWASGLHGAWRALQGLRRVAGRPEDVEPVDKRASWSLKQVYADLGDTFQDRPSPPFAPISMSNTLRRLVKIGRLPFPDPSSLTPNELSFRGLIGVVPF